MLYIRLHQSIGTNYWLATLLAQKSSSITRYAAQHVREIKVHRVIGTYVDRCILRLPDFDHVGSNLAWQINGEILAALYKPKLGVSRLPANVSDFQYRSTGNCHRKHQMDICMRTN